MAIKDILALLGALTLILFVGLIIISVVAGIRELIDTMKHKYRIKHRFDKPPTAKCYCVDCQYHDKENGICYRFNGDSYVAYTTADNWFCWEANPRRKE